MRTLAIGDIHGCSIALQTLLGLVQPQSDDLIITLGDYVDRGPRSRDVLDHLIQLSQQCRLITLRGNHDDLLLRARTNRSDRQFWLLIGGVQTLSSYGLYADDDFSKGIPQEHWDFLQRTLKWYETDTHIYAHATLEAGLPLSAQGDDVLLWAKLDPEFPIRHHSGKILICGHTRQESGLPLDLGTTLCIDTAIYQPTGWLTCLHVEAGFYYQANERGQTRRGTLEQLAALASRDRNPPG